MEKTLVLLAAGMGSRYGGLKQLDQLGPHGETLMDYSIFDALRAGFTRIVFIIRHDIEEEFKRVVGSRYDHVVDVAYAFQSLEDLPAGFTAPAGRTKPWGTGQAVYAARNLVRTPFAVINSDDFYGRTAIASSPKDSIPPLVTNSACADSFCGTPCPRTVPFPAASAL